MKFQPYRYVIHPTGLFALLTAVSAFQSGCVVAEEHPHARREVVAVEVPPPPPPVVVEVPPPQYETVVVENEAPAPVEEIIVREPMPPPRREIIIERPSRRHVWVAGYWHWEGNHYGWVRGHWMLPPREGVIWVAPRVEHRPGGDVFIRGFWRHGGGAGEVTVRNRPAEQAEHRAQDEHQAPAGRQHPADVAMRNPPPEPAEHRAPVEQPGQAGRQRPVDVVMRNMASASGPHAQGIRDAPPPLRREVMTGRPSPRHIWIAGYWRHDGRAYAWVPGRWDKPPREGVAWIAPRWESREGVWVFTEGRWETNEHRSH